MARKTAQQVAIEMRNAITRGDQDEVGRLYSAYENSGDGSESSKWARCNQICNLGLLVNHAGVWFYDSHDDRAHQKKWKAILAETANHDEAETQIAEWERARGVII